MGRAAILLTLSVRLSPPPPLPVSEAEVRGALCDEKAEEEGLWGTIAVFVALFLLSVCYSATVTFFKVRGRDFRWEGLPVGGTSGGRGRGFRLGVFCWMVGDY